MGQQHIKRKGMGQNYIVMRKGMGQQHIKLYSNEERNGSTTYKN